MWYSGSTAADTVAVIAEKGFIGTVRAADAEAGTKKRSYF